MEGDWRSVERMATATKTRHELPIPGGRSGARRLTDAFAGIASHDVLPFIVAQLLGAGCAALVARWLFDPSERQRVNP